MLQNSRVAVFTVFELLRENQLGAGGGVKITPLPPRLGLTKMLEDLPNLDEQMALQYCISVKNCCMYIRGYTPALIAIGKNPKFPSVTQMNYQH